jgi:hypothetical protein
MCLRLDGEQVISLARQSAQCRASRPYLAHGNAKCFRGLVTLPRMADDPSIKEAGDTPTYRLTNGLPYGLTNGLTRKLTTGLATGTKCRRDPRSSGIHDSPDGGAWSYRQYPGNGSPILDGPNQRSDQRDQFGVLPETASESPSGRTSFVGPCIVEPMHTRNCKVGYPSRVPPYGPELPRCTMRSAQRNALRRTGRVPY